MKKFSLLFAALLFAGSMIATEVTITPSDFTETTTADYSTTKGGVTVAVTASTVTADQIRIFKNQSITISAASNITNIVFTCTANGAAKYGPGCFAAQTGYTYEASGNTGTWVGSATSVTFTAESNQVRASQIVVTIEGGASGDTTVVPVDTTVVPVDTTVVPVDTTVVPVDTTNAIISLADAKLLAVGTEITTTGIVTYINGKNAYMQDATDGILLYSTSNFTNFQVGDEIVIDAKVARYGNAPELSNVVLRNIVSSENTVNPILMTLAERVANPLQNFGMMVTINELTITAYDSYKNPTFSDGTNTVAGYKFSMDTTAFPVGSVVDVTAIAGYYNNIQIQGDPTGVVMHVYPVIYYPVAFLDWDGTVLTRDSIARGAAATAPAAPVREGYEFLGWSKDYSNIQGEMFIIALYEQEQAPVEGILVSYIDGVDNSLIGNDTIVLNIPEAPIHEGYTFQGWMTVVGNPEDGITIQATYQNNDPTQVQQQTYVPEAGETRKVFENGKVYVVRDGKTFTMQGQEVR